MAQDVIDNHSIRLVDRVGEFLGDGASIARFAVGNLFLDGLIPLRPHFLRLDEIYFLIGNVVNRLSERRIREETDSRARGGADLVRDQADVASTLRMEHDRFSVETSLNLRNTIAGMRRDDETRALLLTLAARIADGGLKVRLYPRGRIHAKVALVSYPSIINECGIRSSHAPSRDVAIVGSSNLTLAASPQPTEMNIVVRSGEALDDLNRWYTGLWDQGQDFHRELFDELGQSWALE